jgi:hypothetical protein
MKDNNQEDDWVLEHLPYGVVLFAIVLVGIAMSLGALV